MAVLKIATVAMVLAMCIMGLEAHRRGHGSRRPPCLTRMACYKEYEFGGDEMSTRQCAASACNLGYITINKNDEDITLTFCDITEDWPSTGPFPGVLRAACRIVAADGTVQKDSCLADNCDLTLTVRGAQATFCRGPGDRLPRDGGETPEAPDTSQNPEQPESQPDQSNPGTGAEITSRVGSQSGSGSRFRGWRRF